MLAHKIIVCCCGIVCATAAALVTATFFQTNQNPVDAKKATCNQPVSQSLPLPRRPLCTIEKLCFDGHRLFFPKHRAALQHHSILSAYKNKTAMPIRITTTSLYQATKLIAQALLIQLLVQKKKTQLKIVRMINSIHKHKKSRFYKKKTKNTVANCKSQTSC